jgi:Family of unknown function (DUF6325)
MDENRTEEMALGPVDIVVIGYPPGTPQTGSAVPLLIDLVDRGIVHLLDVRGVRREADGTFSAFDVGDNPDPSGIPDLMAFEGAQTGLIGDDDLRVAVEAMEPGSAAILICFENSWAAPFVTEVRRNGGRMLAFERVPAEDVIEAVDRLDAAEATA